jgi:PAS domain S-box-containing protein
MSAPKREGGDPELHVSELSSLLASLLDSLGIGLGVVGMGGRVVVQNDTLRRVLDVAGAELFGHHANLLADWAAGIPSAESFELVTEVVPRHVGEKRYVRSDGTELWARMGMGILPDKAGGPQLAVAVCRDVSRERDLEKKLRSVATVVVGFAPSPRRHLPFQDDELAAKLKALSRREKEVVRLLAANRRVASIAKALGLTPRTVRNHLVSVYRKLGVNSQASLLELLHPEEASSASGTDLG